MYGLGHVSTQYSTKITPKIKYISVSKNNNIHQSTYFHGSLSHLHSVDQKFRLHALPSYMIFLLCSYLHLQTWRPATLGASSRRGVSGGVEGHHWEYNPFLVQSTVHTVFTPMLSSYMGRVKLLHHGAHIHCFYRPHIACC